jgi:tRNA pseudouridine55 synthase
MNSVLEPRGLASGTRAPGLHGVLVVDKPEGPTSHDIVDRVRKLLRERRVGHTGTLDPLATGVLPVCVGKATRLARFLAATDKAYRAELRLGFATATDDQAGQPLGPPQPVRCDRAAIEEACRGLQGRQMQRPPAFSAKHVDGRRAHELARAGVAVDLAAAPVTVHAIELVDFDADRLVLDVACSTGTYIRSLARDLGERLGCGAHLSALRRTRSGGFGLESAVDLRGLEPAEAASRLLPLSGLLLEVPAVVVGDAGLRALLQGRPLERALVLRGFPEAPPERLRVLDEAGDLLALAVPRGFGAGVPGLPVVPSIHADVVLAAA